jgi:hypothetical protein
MSLARKRQFERKNDHDIIAALSGLHLQAGDCCCALRLDVVVCGEGRDVRFKPGVSDRPRVLAAGALAAGALLQTARCVVKCR